jgi:hypothetical protein
MYNYFGIGLIMVLIVFWHISRNIIDRIFNLWKRI